MKLSVPIYRLKQEAKTISRTEQIPLHEALRRIAIREGFEEWSHMASKWSVAGPATKLYAQLLPGELIIIGARPGQGKTLLSLELAIEAMKAGNGVVFFSLEYSGRNYRERFLDLGIDLAAYGSSFQFDGSDSICAAHIECALSDAPSGTFAVIDYLQLLDQKRDTPPLMDQVRSLRLFAHKHGVVMAFISQIDRSYEPETKPLPGLADIRLPNPLDLALFDKACFLQGGQFRVESRR